jgi:hypothetical protein
MDEFLKVQPRMRAEAEFQDVFPSLRFPRLKGKDGGMGMTLSIEGSVLSVLDTLLFISSPLGPSSRETSLK